MRYVLFPRSGLFTLTLLALLAGCASGPGPGDDRDGLSPFRTPEQERATFHIDPGLTLELVAAEPLIEEPVAITFDAAGRLWVVEMRGYMQAIGAASDTTRIGRIKVLTDTDGDGAMDTSVIFLDSLVLPRAVAPVPGGALVAEDRPLWMAYDDDGDLQADRRVLVDSAYGVARQPEHAANGLWRGIDNWYYNAKSAVRYRLVGNAWRRDSTEFRGQWGISHDDTGRLFYNYNWSELHADLVPPNTFRRNPHHTPTTGLNVGLATERAIYPIRETRAVNRGYLPDVLDAQGRLREFTSAGSPFIYRGSALPQMYRGNAFVSEPAGNLVRRSVLTYGDFAIAALPADPGREFLASTDERFRPVFFASGPDGALYVVDMYRGIIQDGIYMTPYLREQIEKRKLEVPVRHGRIWRVVPERWSRPTPFSLAEASPTELVARLSDDDGWVRDTAQRLLVERGDRSIIPYLERVVSRDTERRGRLHALWTLEGLDAVALPILEKAMLDRDVDVRAAALRILTDLAPRRAGARALLTEVVTRGWTDAPPAVALQMVLAAGALEHDAAVALLTDLLGLHGEEPLFRDAAMSSLAGREAQMLGYVWTEWAWQPQTIGRAVFLEMLATAIRKRSDASEIELLLARLDVPAWDWRHQALLAGIVAPMPGPPLALSAVPAVVSRASNLGAAEQAAMGQLLDRFAWPGHTPAVDTTSGKPAIDPERLATGRQHYLTVCAACHGSDGAGLPSMAPPLAGSEWVTGSKETLIRIVLHGLEGPIEVAGRTYQAPDINPVMPSFATLDDAAISAILTYIRNSWGQHAGPITPRDVGQLRLTSQGRVTPWSAGELRDLERAAPAPSL